MLRTSGARFLFTVTDFLDTDYVALLDEAGARDLVEEIVILEGAVPEGTVSWSDFLARGAGVDTGAIDAEIEAREAALDGDTMCDIIFTSGTTGAPKGAMLRHGASVRAYASWADVVGLRHGDRYLLVYPLFHTAGLKSGSGRVAAHRHHAAPPPGVRHAVGDGHGAGGADHDAPRPARDLPDDPQRRPLRVRLLLAAPRGHRRRRRPGRAGGPDARAARARVRGDRLRAHRDHRHREHVPPRRRPRDHRPHVGTTDSRGRDEDRRRRRQRPPYRRAGRDRGPRLPGDDRLLRQPDRDRRDHRRRTGGCTPATSGTSTPTTT